MPDLQGSNKGNRVLRRDGSGAGPPERDRPLGGRSGSARTPRRVAPRSSAQSEVDAWMEDVSVPVPCIRFAIISSGSRTGIVLVGNLSNPIHFIFSGTTFGPPPRPGETYVLLHAWNHWTKSLSDVHNLGPDHQARGPQVRKKVPVSGTIPMWSLVELAKIKAPCRAARRYI